MFGKARIGLELALIQKFDGSQNPISSRAGIDHPNRPFAIDGANVCYPIAKQSFKYRDRFGTILGRETLNPVGCFLFLAIARLA